MDEIKTVLITGASGGLGSSLTKTFSDNGYLVFAVGRNKIKLEELKSECKKGKIITIQADFLDDKSFENIYKIVKRYTKRLDILINNAGIGVVGEFYNSKIDDVKNMLTVNCLTPVCLTRLFLPEMILAKKGKIINISSTGGITTLNNLAVYGATKHFINGLTKNLNRELKGTGVKVLAVMPGSMNTKFGLNNKSKESTKKNLGENPDIIAQAVFRKINQGPFIFPTFRSRATCYYDKILTLLHIR